MVVWLENPLLEYKLAPPFNARQSLEARRSGGGTFFPCNKPGLMVVKSFFPKVQLAEGFIEDDGDGVG